MAEEPRWRRGMAAFGAAHDEFHEALGGLHGEIAQSRRLLGQVAVTLRAAERSAPTRPRRTAGNRRVLIVEDHVDGAAELQHGLASFGHVAEIAHSPSAALVLSRYFDPDVALLDIGLPELDGWELARRLRLQLATIHLIAVTGYGSDADRERSREAGIADHMVKPVDVRVLARMVADT